MREVKFQRHPGQQTLEMLDIVTDLYTAIKSEDPDGSDEIFSRSSFITRTRKQACDSEFELVSATAGGMLVGFSFGYPFAPGKWWADSSEPAPEVLRASKFAVIELDVRKEFRGLGLSKKLLGDLLANRTEDFATLAAIPDTQAYSMYLRWGWHKAGVLGGDGPAMHALIFRLSDG